MLASVFGFDESRNTRDLCLSGCTTGSQGWHNVSELEIRGRYDKSLGLINESLEFTNHAYFFDNSLGDLNLTDMWIAEITDGETLEHKKGLIPDWYRRSVLVLNQLGNSED